MLESLLMCNAAVLYRFTLKILCGCMIRYDLICMICMICWPNGCPKHNCIVVPPPPNIME